jgi:hypothetical protein
MKSKHLETNFFKYLVEKYKEEIEQLDNQISPEETNLNDEELIDEVELINRNQSQKLPQSQSQKETENDEPSDKLIEKLIRIISKKQNNRNGSIRRK